MKLSTSEKKLLSIIIDGGSVPKDKKGKYSIYMHKAVQKLVEKSLIYINDDNQVAVTDMKKVKQLITNKPNSK